MAEGGVPEPPGARLRGARAGRRIPLRLWLVSGDALGERDGDHLGISRNIVKDKIPWRRFSRLGLQAFRFQMSLNITNRVQTRITVIEPNKTQSCELRLTWAIKYPINSPHVTTVAIAVVFIMRGSVIFMGGHHATAPSNAETQHPQNSN